jgi:large subunit ribosomal protein L4
VFGPRNIVNFSKDMNQKMKKKALLSAFVLQLHQENLVGLDAYTSSQMKTKDAIAMLQALPKASSKTLVVLDTENDIIKKSLRNIEKVIFTSAIRLNAYELVDAKRVIFIGNALNQVVTRMA